jgi:hypothetical protein
MTTNMKYETTHDRKDIGSLEGDIIHIFRTLGAFREARYYIGWYAFQFLHGECHHTLNIKKQLSV